MKVYKIINETTGEKIYIRTNADEETVEFALSFIPDTDVQKLLQAIRIQGFKASEVKLDPVRTFKV